MKIEVTITRTYEMDDARVLAEPGFDPPATDASDDEKKAWLKESFYELCGWQRDRDHLDGKYVWLVDEDDWTEFWWPRATSTNSHPRGDE